MNTVIRDSYGNREHAETTSGSWLETKAWDASIHIRRNRSPPAYSWASACGLYRRLCSNDQELDLVCRRRLFRLLIRITRLLFRCVVVVLVVRLDQAHVLREGRRESTFTNWRTRDRRRDEQRNKDDEKGEIEDSIADHALAPQLRLLHGINGRTDLPTTSIS